MTDNDTSTEPETLLGPRLSAIQAK